MYIDSHNKHMTSDHKFEETVEEIAIIFCGSDDQDWMDRMEKHSANSAVPISNKRRNVSISHSKRRLQGNVNFNLS